MGRRIKRLQALRSRRQKAIALFDQGERQAAVAAALKVSRQSVCRWYRDWLNDDSEALHGAARAGRRRRLSSGQIALIQKELLEGAAQGYPSDLWTLPRVAQVIEAVTAVHYHPGHIWRLLRQMDRVCNRRA